MASYPTSVKTYTTKSDGSGNTIFASHINDLQDEITAIEDGILNGTAPLNSSRSTLAALSVSGASTFTGTVLCSSLVHAPNQPRVSAYSSATQTLSSASTAVLTLDVEEYDIGGLHSTASNPSRITIPAGSSGVYDVLGRTAAVVSSGAAGDVVRLYLRKNGTDVIGAQTAYVSTTVGVPLDVAHTLFLDATDYVELAGATLGVPSIFGSASAVFTSRLVVKKHL